MILDLILMTAPIVIVFIAAMKMILPWRTFDLTKPPPPPPPAWLSFLGLGATLLLLARWVITGKPWSAIAFCVLAIVSMAWTCRISVRAEIQHEESERTWERYNQTLKELGDD